MSFFANSTKQPTIDKPNYTGVQVQTAVNTLPIPIVYGCARGAPNLIDYTDYASHADKAQQGGKGGSSDSSTQSYSATVIMGLSEGPIAGIGRVWANSTTTTNYQSLGFSMFVGTTGQTAWGYMASKHADKALSYPGTAYLAQANYNLGSSPSMPNHNMEIFGLLSGTSDIGGNPDADMALVIRDFLTNPQYGVGFPDGSIDLTSLLSGNYLAGHGYAGSNDASYQSYCAALGLFMSPALFSQENAATILQRWLMLTHTAAVWSGTRLRFIPYGDEPQIGNGVSFTPDVTPIYDLDDDDFIADTAQDPIEITRTDLADAKNCVRVEIADRANAYNLVPIEAKDQNAIEQYGLRTDTSITAHEICDPVTCAPMVAQLILQRNIHIRNSYSFKLSWEYCLLEPMDLVTLTDPALGLDKTAVRITAIEEDEQGLLTVTAEEFPAGVATATLYPKQSRNPYVVNYNVAADPVNPPVIFEPSPLLSDGKAQIWIGASGGVNGVADPYWGGAEVWLSLDNVTYQQIGAVQAPARQGILTHPLPLASGTDTINTISADLTESGGVLGSGSQADAQAGRTLIWVDGEIMGYASATLIDAAQYSLAFLVRGLAGTSAAAHAAGSQFLRLDEAVFKYDLPAAYVGSPLFIKLPSYNVWGGGRQSLADAHAYGLTPIGTGYYIAPPTGALITSSARTAGDGTHLLSVAITWTASAGPLLDHYEVQWQLQGASAWQSIIVGGNATDTVITPAQENATYAARVRAVSTTGNLSVWNVAGSANSGALANVVPAAPTGFAGSGGTRLIALHWNANPESDIDGYRVLGVQGSDTNIGDAATVALTQATSLTFANRSYGESWSFWLEAYNIAGSSSPAGPLTLTTDYTIPIAAIQLAALEESYLAADLSSRIDLIDAGAQTPGSVNNRVSSEISQRQAADNSLASQLTEVIASLDDAHGAALAAVVQDVTSQATSTTALARSVIQLVSALAGNSVTVEQAMETKDGIFGLWTVKIANNGYMSGFGLYSGPAASGTTQSQFVIEADQVLFLPPPPAGTDYGSLTAAQLQAAARKVLVYDAVAGQLVVDSALINKVQANALTSGTISSANIEVHPPADGSGGLKVFDSTGNLVLDPTHGIYPGASSVQLSQSWASIPLGVQLYDLLNNGVVFSGRLIMVYVSAKSDYAADSSNNDINMHIEISVDGAEIYGNNALPTGVTNLIPVMLQPANGAHNLKVSIGTRTGATTARNVTVALIDWKA